MATRATWQRQLEWIGNLFVLVAFASLGYYAVVSGEAMLYQASEDRALDALRADRHAVNSSAEGRLTAPHSAIGRLEIPRLGVSAIIREGTDAGTLRLAVGHIRGTASPGEGGNVGLAGHRDTFFRRLREIRSGDEVRLTTLDGRFSYRVTSTSIVLPDDSHVLQDTPAPSLTLVTCYPFYFVGPAPRRFIVRAERPAG